MYFWKKDSSRKVIKLLRDAEKKVMNLTSFSKQRDKVEEIANKTLLLLSQAEKEIELRFEEELNDILVDSSFDEKIISMKKNELEELARLKSKIKADVLDYVSYAESNEDINNLVGELIRYSEDIINREEESKAKFDDFKRQTIAMRFNRSFVEPPFQNLNDGTPWKNVVNVCRMLGANRFEPVKGHHQFKIYFPNSSRPIPLSKDVGTQFVASDIVSCLREFMPPNKIPNQSKIEYFLKRGKI